MTTKNLKDSIIALPIIGYTARVLHSFLKAPVVHQRVMADQEQLNNAITRIETTNTDQFTHINNAITELNTTLASMQLVQDNLRQQFGILEAASTKAVGPKAKDKPGNTEELFADDHILDTFYTNFEDRFRGSEEMIEERLVEYLPYFEKSKIDFNEKPILDIGSGRGELLQLLAKHNFHAIGLDINYDMVERSMKKGLDAVQGDVLQFLHKAKSQSYGAITGFHIVEHIPFNILLRVFTDAHRVLAKDGFVIFETPNPENVVVASDTFHMDPSHLHPLPPALLAFTLETCGFRNIEIKRLHPDEQMKSAENLPETVKTRLFGPRDYAVIGYK